MPVFWSPGDGSGGYSAALVFRAGRVDEPLARAGITHMVEHLALHRLGREDRHYNGAVGPFSTRFVSHGTPDEVAGFLTGVCAALRDLPLDRLDDEKRIVRTEEDQRAFGVVETLARWRYGPSGLGLVGYPELGVPGLTGENVAGWAASRFTRGNVALGIVGGPPPEGLRLDLPDGPRIPVPESDDLTNGRTYFQERVNGVGFSGVVPAGPAARVYRELLLSRLHRALRLDRALSYTPQAEFQRTGPGSAAIIAFADGLDEVLPELVEAFLAELDALAEGRFDEADLGRAVTELQAARPEAESHVSGRCLLELIGATQRTSAEARERLGAVTAEEVAKVAQAAMDSALLMLPHGVGCPDGRYRPAPTASTRAVAGRVHSPYEKSGEVLIAGASGVTKMYGPTPATIRYDECAAVLAWPDGARVLYGPDGIVITLEPGRWSEAERLIAEIDAHVDADRVSWQPARDAAQIPEPPSAEPYEAVVPQTKPGRFAKDVADHDHNLAALTSAMPRVRSGDLDAGLALLAGTRDNGEERCLAADRLGAAAVPHVDALVRMADARPDDPDVQLWLGATRIAQAWNARTGAHAEDLEAVRFHAFWRLLAQAGEPLYRAAELLPDDPAPWDRLQRHAIGLQLGRPEIDRLWDEAVRRGPDVYALHRSRLQALCRKWWGTDAEALAFAERAVADADPGDARVALIAEAHTEIAVELDRHPENGMAWLTYISEPDVHGAIADAADRWVEASRPHPRDPLAHRMFGEAFYYAGDFDRARRHLVSAGVAFPGGSAKAMRRHLGLRARRVRKARL